MKKVLSFLLIFLEACSWRSPNSDFYMMNSADLSPISQKVMNVNVAKIKVPDILDRSQLVVYEPKNNQVKILEFNRWGENFADVVQSTIVNDLIAYLPKSYVKRTYFDSQQTPYNINIEVNNMQAFRGEKVIFSAWWNISNAAGKILVRQQSNYEIEVDGKSIDDLVKAQTQTVHLLSKAIAEQLINL